MPAATPTEGAGEAEPEAPSEASAAPARDRPEGSRPASEEARPKLVLGLGNPGERYVATRHNLGFRVVEELARRRGQTLVDDECACRLALSGAPAGLLLAQPQTFMNRSGHAARCLVERYGFAPAEVLVVYDEVALPLGRLRLRPSGGPAGHRGMESVLGELRTDEVARLRLGIAPAEAPGDLVAFVLAPFAADELEVVEPMISRAADACEAWAVEGAERAMNRFNA
ncbi:MAG TPA: aminoacyl-tRNA hydrolase [Thermoanaerobaculia bacterium]|nr:aminoacyl-tRNA hydrolase [Thermoanaerobaculia bacterium]